MLLSSRCKIFGLDESERLSFVVSNAEMELISVIGSPSKEAILDAVTSNGHQGVILAFADNSDCVAQALPDWNGNLAFLHLLNDYSRLPSTRQREVRFLAPGELETALLPAELKEELTMASHSSPISAAFADDIPVSFCYAGSETESLWDISIDTLVEYRNRGYAGLSVAYLVEHMRERGKQPVWGAEDKNMASMRLAAKLGFTVVDQLMVFKPQNQD
jgi:hypothetical protein